MGNFNGCANLFRLQSVKWADMGSDLELIEAFKRGDRGAFDALVLRHQQNIRSLMLRSVSSSEDADDLAQEVFVTAFRKLKKFRGDAAFSTWLYRVAMNRLASFHRRSKWRQFFSLSEEMEPAEEGLPETYGQLREDMFQGIKRLSQRQRQVVLLRGLQGLSTRETAAVLATSENAVKVAYHSAKDQLRGLIEDAY